MFVYVPASMSACVTVCVAAHTTEAPGASVGRDHRRARAQHRPDAGSVTVTPVRVTLPVFVTVIA